MKKNTLILLAVALLTLFGRSSNGDERKKAESGKRVRVTAPAPERVSGRIVEKDDDLLTVVSKEGATPLTFTRRGRSVTGMLLTATDETILLQQSGDGKAIRIPRAAVVKLEVSRAPGRRKYGAGIGAATGLAAAFVLAAIVASSDDGGYFDFGFGVYAIAGSIFFVPIGAAVGAIVAPGERWEDVTLEGQNPFRASNPRVGLAFAIRF
jgi:hypothetical protein